MDRPYIYETEATSAARPVGFDPQKGLIFEQEEGRHLLWAARVPFLPAMRSDDFTRAGVERVAYVRERQGRFIRDLARNRDHRATFELRFISRPTGRPGAPNWVEIVAFGKVFVGHGSDHAPAEQLWERFAQVFPLEDPFNYPLEPITNLAAFQRVYEPMPFDELRCERILEIRKFEDLPPRRQHALTGARHGDYIAHPFMPNVAVNPMGRFFAALADQPGPCFASVSLRPVCLLDEEVDVVSAMIDRFGAIATEEDEEPPTRSGGLAPEYVRSRAGIGTFVYRQLMAEREQLLSVRVQVVGSYELPQGLAEALGSEMMGSAENPYPTRWAGAAPTDQEWPAVLRNLRYLEQEEWGASRAAPQLRRLRYLATPREAFGAFRLPVPPESGYLPGLAVKNEPFVAPTDGYGAPDGQAGDRAARHAPVVGLGEIYHRGSRTPQVVEVDVRDLTRHALIAGSTGSGKTTTVKQLLAQLWPKHRVPFLVLYPIDKPDYRDLRRLPGLEDDLLVFTLGDPTTSPFRFNPFEVPDGLLIKTHLSRLMRVFSSAFTLQDPLPMVYRQALREVYREKGLDPAASVGRTGDEYPIMSEFHAAIDRITGSLNYGREVQDNVRQAWVIRIGDLLENAGHTLNVRRSMSLEAILDRPTVMEVGRVGSPQDTALMMGFLLMRFAEEVERNPRRPPRPPHLTVVEEAHRVMAEVASAGGVGDPRAAAGEDFANILAEVRGHGEGIIIAEQIPTLLVKGAIGNTYLKVMHWLEDAASFELFSNIMNLSPEQREYARTLTPGFAIVRDPSGRPAHLKVPELTERPGDDSDAAIRAYMAGQRERCGIDLVPVVAWGGDSLAASRPGAAGNDGLDRSGSNQPTDLDLLLAAPMPTCAGCAAYQRTGACHYGLVVRNDLLGWESFRAARLAELETALAQDALDQRWQCVQTLGGQVEALLQKGATGEQRAGYVYCLLAHLVNAMRVETLSAVDSGGTRVKRALGLLKLFNDRYQVLDGGTI